MAPHAALAMRGVKHGWFGQQGDPGRQSRQGSRRSAAPRTAARSPTCASPPPNPGATRPRASASEKTEWHSVVIFNENLCKIAEQYLKKGSKVYIEGALQTRKWQDQDGQDRYSTEVVLQGFNGNLTMLDGRRAAAACRRTARPTTPAAEQLRQRRRARAAAAAAPERRQLRQAARRRDPVLSHVTSRHCPGARLRDCFFLRTRRIGSTAVVVTAEPGCARMHSRRRCVLAVRRCCVGAGTRSI